MASAETDKITEGVEELHVHDEEVDEEANAAAAAYKPPAQKSIEEILAADEGDESLRKYKETLLGEAQTGKIIVCKFLKQDFYLVFNNYKINLT